MWPATGVEKSWLHAQLKLVAYWKISLNQVAHCSKLTLVEFQVYRDCEFDVIKDNDNR